jgi:hypothetical protein
MESHCCWNVAVSSENEPFAALDKDSISNQPDSVLQPAAYPTMSNPGWPLCSNGDRCAPSYRAAFSGWPSCSDENSNDHTQPLTPPPCAVYEKRLGPVGTPDQLATMKVRLPAKTMSPGSPSTWMTLPPIKHGAAGFEFMSLGSARSAGGRAPRSAGAGGPLSKEPGGELERSSGGIGVAVGPLAAIVGNGRARELQAVTSAKHDTRSSARLNISANLRFEIVGEQAACDPTMTICAVNERWWARLANPKVVRRGSKKEPRLVATSSFRALAKKHRSASSTSPDRTSAAAPSRANGVRSGDSSARIAAHDCNRESIVSLSGRV